MHALMFFVIVFTILGCNSNRLETSHKKSKELDSVTKRIAFDYTTTRYIETRFDSSKLSIVKVEVRLTNQNPDTVYFLSFYCNRGEELLQYDTARFYKYFTHCVLLKCHILKKYHRMEICR